METNPSQSKKKIKRKMSLLISLISVLFSKMKEIKNTDILKNKSSPEYGVIFLKESFTRIVGLPITNSNIARSQYKYQAQNRK